MIQIIAGIVFALLIFSLPVKWLTGYWPDPAFAAVIAAFMTIALLRGNNEEQ